MHELYKKIGFTAKGADWPPPLAKMLVSIALFYCKQKRTKRGIFEFTKVLNESASALASSAYQRSSPKKARIDYFRVTKNIANIFAADPTDLTEISTSSTNTPKRILIEGTPGIGKTVLAKEIAYCWANKEILTKIKIVFLLYLRDPQLQEIKYTMQLIEYMSMGVLANHEKF